MTNSIALIEGLKMLMDPFGLVLAAFGVLFGTVLGMIPGLTGSVGIAIMLPMTVLMEPFQVMTLLLGIYAGGIYGGSITAILINTPGAPAAVCTAGEGYPMNKQGRGLRALYIAMIASVAGGVIGCIFLVASIGFLGKVVLKFGPCEMFAIGFMALSIVATISTEAPYKTLFIGFMGALLGTVGYSTSGMLRGTLGFRYMMDGVPQIPALVGVFAVSEALVMIIQTYNVSEEGFELIKKQKKWTEFRAAAKSVFSKPVTLVVSSLLGTFIGALPAAGASAATIVAYGTAKRGSKHPEMFGKGSEEGLVAAESSNNACQGGAMATTFILGVPGSAVGAMILSAIYLQGWVAGPRMFLDYKDIMYGVLDMMFLEQLLIIPAGLLVIMLTYKIIKIPNYIIGPCLLVIAVAGAFACRKAMFDVYVMLIFGLVAYFLKTYKFPTIALILGLMLGKIVDSEMIRIGQRFHTYFAVFTRPISCVFMIITIAALAWSLYKEFKISKYSI